jgi:hypothetical protein
MAASASPSATVTATTHLADRPDTCDAKTAVSSPNGYVWAYDNMARQFTITSNGDGTYTVAIADTGSFSAIADPVTGATISAHGSVNGTNQYTVTATQGPNVSGLPAQVPGDTSTSAMITTELFHAGTAKITGEGNYTYSYRAGTHTYTQTSSSITGDITGK